MKYSLNDIMDFVKNVDISDDKRLQLVSTFKESYDKEIVAIISSWLYNGYSIEEYTIERTIEMMMPSPVTFVLKPNKDVVSADNGCFCGMMSNMNFINLIGKIRDCLLLHESLQVCFNSYMNNYKRHKCKYVHDALAMMFSGGTGLPTKASKSSFFRYNYLYYLLYKLNIWANMDISKALIPCNDMIIQRAYQYGIVDESRKSDLGGAIALTNKAKAMFGEKDFYILYEFLNFAKDDIKQ